MSVSISTSIAATTTSISVGKSAVAHPSAVGEGATPPTSPRCSLPFMTNGGVDSSALLQQKITTFFADKIDKARKSVDNAAVARGAQATTATTNRQRSLSPAAFPPLLSSLLLRFGGSADQFAANKQQQQLQQQNKCCCSSLGSSTTSSSVETTVAVSSADDDEELTDKNSVVASTIEEKRNSIEASAPNAIEERGTIDNDEPKQKTPVTECEVKILKEIQDGINDANLFLGNKQISQRKESIQSLENASRNSSVGSIGDLLQKQNCSVNTSSVSLISDVLKNHLLPQQPTSTNLDCKKRYSSPQIVNGNNNPSVVPLIPPRRSFQGTECVEHTTSKEACQQFVKQLGPHQDGKDQQPKENSIKIITQNCPPAMLKKVVEKQSKQSKRPPQQQRKNFLALPTGLTTKQHEQQRRSISLSRHLIHTATRLSSTAAGHSLALATKVSTATAAASGAPRATSGQRTTATDKNNTPRPSSVNSGAGNGTASSAATALAMFNQVRRISEPLQRQRRRFSSIMHGFTDEFFLLQQPNGEKSVLGGAAHGGSSLNREWEVVTVRELARRLSLDDFEPSELPLPEGALQSQILDEFMIRQIVDILPPRAEGYPWVGIYCAEKHGFSLATLYRKMAEWTEEISPTLLVMRDTTGHVFGAIASTAFHPSEHYFGTGDSCLLFRFTGEYPNTRELKSYVWTGENQFFVNATKDSLSFGAGGGHFGLWLDADLNHGRSQKCATFDNEPLAGDENEDFIIQDLEVFGFSMSE